MSSPLEIRLAYPQSEERHDCHEIPEPSANAVEVDQRLEVPDDDHYGCERSLKYLFKTERSVQLRIREVGQSRFEFDLLLR